MKKAHDEIILTSVEGMFLVTALVLVHTVEGGQSKVSQFEHEAAVHHTVGTLQAPMHTYGAVMEVTHALTTHRQE